MQTTFLKLSVQDKWIRWIETSSSYINLRPCQRSETCAMQNPKEYKYRRKTWHAMTMPQLRSLSHRIASDRSVLSLVSWVAWQRRRSEQLVESRRRRRRCACVRNQLVCNVAHFSTPFLAKKEKRVAKVTWPSSSPSPSWSSELDAAQSCDFAR